MNIRKAKVKEVPKLAKLGVELIKYHHELDPFFAPSKNIESSYKTYFKKCVYSPKSLLLVAEEEGKIVGYALGTITSRPPVFKERKIGYIDDMFVVKEYRRSGVGKEFLNELFKWFKNKKAKHTEITVHTKNFIGRKAWENFGFEEYCTKLLIGTKTREK